MTREEAIRYCDEYLARHISDIDKEFLKIAKEALQQKPCTDAISRQAVLEELPRRTMKNYFGEVVGDVVYIDDIKTLPPVTPQEQETVSKESYDHEYFLRKELEVKIAKLEHQQPCEDCISRKAAIDAIYARYIGGKEAVDKAPANDQYAEGIDEAVCAVEDLPPVTPQLKTGWIPVSERLPKKFRYVNCTCHSLIDDREDWVVETVYIPQPSNSPYSDWGNIPMLNWGECEVIAWMYRDIPKPYKAESEE